MKPISLVKEAHFLVKQRLQQGATAIDATVGNGFDTLFLAQQVGLTGKVFGFDIQQSALDRAWAKLEEAHLTDCVTLSLADHALMADKIPACYHGQISAVMFNLGYLPGSDKTIITSAQSTLPALNSAVQLLASEGMITIVAYPGHSGGDIETDQVDHWCHQLNRKQYTVLKIPISANNPATPILFAVINSTMNQSTSM